MTKSKSKQKRFWDMWRKSGAVKAPKKKLIPSRFENRVKQFLTGQGDW